MNLHLEITRSGAAVLFVYTRREWYRVLFCTADARLQAYGRLMPMTCGAVAGVEIRNRLPLGCLWT